MQVEMRKREQELLAKIKEQQKELDTVKEEMIKELSGNKGSTILECKLFFPFRFTNTCIFSTIKGSITSSFK